MRRIAMLSFLGLSAGLFAVEKPDLEKVDHSRAYAVVSEISPARVVWITPQPIEPHLRTDNTCYTMHTLIAEKKPQSDETEIVKQRTCTPASQFQVKHADQPAK